MSDRKRRKKLVPKEGVWSCHPLAKFVYVLVHNHLPVGVVDKIVESVLETVKDVEEAYFISSDELLKKYSTNIARKLMPERSHMCSDCEEDFSIENVRNINPSSCAECPFFYQDDDDDICNALDSNAIRISDPSTISPLCILRRCNGAHIYLREDQKKR